jgi:hypothetical protein
VRYGADNVGDTFINLNRHLTTNGLRKIDSGEKDPRRGAWYYHGVGAATPTKEGVENVLTVGAPDNH